MQIEKRVYYTKVDQKFVEVNPAGYSFTKFMRDNDLRYLYELSGDTWSRYILRKKMRWQKLKPHHVPRQLQLITLLCT